MCEPPAYVGRFAPSPTGPLHFGSLLAAVASYLEARVRGGRWFVRIEDIDPPREQPGAAADIIESLQRYGFEADASPVFQHDSRNAHHAALQALLAGGHAYYCDCSRRDFGKAGQGPLGVIYPGTCRHRQMGPAGDRAVRVDCDAALIDFDDRLQGPQSQALDIESGDFVVHRRDGLPAYQLAVVVDDFLQGVTDIVRGIDLMASTHRQIHLQRLLGYPTPGYAHIPVAVDAEGRKLSKSTGAPALPATQCAAVIARALEALGQSPPAALGTAPLASVWEWAIGNWQPRRLAGQRALFVAQPLW